MKQTELRSKKKELKRLKINNLYNFINSFKNSLLLWFIFHHTFLGLNQRFLWLWHRFTVTSDPVVWTVGKAAAAGGRYGSHLVSVSVSFVHIFTFPLRSSAAWQVIDHPVMFPQIPPQHLRLHVWLHTLPLWPLKDCLGFYCKIKVLKLLFALRDILLHPRGKD